MQEFYDEVSATVFQRLTAELPVHYTYHSVDHTRDVESCAQRIGKACGLDSSDLALLKVAALFHDTGFLIQRSQHEETSCTIFRQYAAAFTLNEEDMKKVEGCILATKIPQTPQSLLEMVICDADLDYLGRPDFEPIAEQLFRELNACGEITDRNQWNVIQVNFLSKHKYFTEYSQNLRREALEAHIELVKRNILN
jgi:predicted metal-dependent HD superfamily phosphohydrolase